ncbi:ABC transporter permease subunit [Pseudofrankia inefficax]|uniref:Inner-membrane translocator n=1 Tax=Pseudofrankia inefficax (strain DSM 45817 / CECT 9037 / DDB 130130 / EuI1c) TaxID=298654 RepID=E3J0G8_PSEI1|nr:ATP-binding cassette domain-containing protein [Pseudofrankia inefficax]ADP81597.1 inner-membrane translocator [Pseudofrankia inefficax]
MDPRTILQFALLGLGVGGVYAVSAVGIVTIHRGSRTINFAQGGIALWGALVFYSLRDSAHLPGPAAAVLTLIAAAVFGALVYLLVIRPIRHRTQLSRMVATLGLLGFLVGLAHSVFPNAARVPDSSLPATPVHLAGITIPAERIVIFALAVVVVALLAAWSAWARLPLMTRAMAEHESAAQALGGSPHLLGSLNWALGSALAAAAGILVAPIVGQFDTAMLTVMAFALAAALVGRFDGYLTALAGGLGLGVGEGVVTHLVGQYVPQQYQLGWPQTVPFVAVMLVLVFRRDRASNRLPAVPAAPVAAGLFRPLPVAVALAAAAVVLATGNASWRDAATTSAIGAILVLSLVVLVGYANQISLAQLTVAGLGAYAAVRLDIGVHLPFLLAPVAGAAVGAVAGLLVGLPALRVRGVNLAILTMGMAVAVSGVLFESTHYTGGITGMQPRPPRLFGLPVDAATHPDRYGYYCLFWLVLAGAAVVAVRRSGLGRRLLVVRTNERAAASVGISVARAKLSAFVISAALAGAAGALLAMRTSSVTFEQFAFMDSINLVSLAVIAGVTSVTGGLLGGVLGLGGLLYLAISDLHIGFVTDNYATIFGAGLVLTVLVHENGVAWRRRFQHDPAPLPTGTASSRRGAALVADEVTVRFGGVTAVAAATLTAPPGIVTGLVGPNGAGKTTLLDAVGGFAPTSQGQVRLGEHALAGRAPDARARAGLGRVFQAGELFEDLTVAQNLRVAAENAGHTGGRLTAPARAALERFGLTEDLARLPGELPMAKRRLVGIARALAANPAAVLLDEPGAGLSMTEITALAASLRELAHDDGLAVLVVDHDMALVMSACDRIVVLHQGGVLADGTPEEIRASSAVRDAYLGAADEIAQPAAPPEAEVPAATPGH